MSLGILTKSFQGNCSNGVLPFWLTEKITIRFFFRFKGRCADKRNGQETQEDTKVVQGPVDALMVAVNYLYEEKYPAVNVITNKFDLEKFAGFEDKINLVVFTERAKHYPIKSGFSV